MEILIGGAIAIVLGLATMVIRCYRKVGPEEALVRSGQGGLAVITGRGLLVYPVLHRVEQMDLSVKRIEITRRGEAGLICRDNIRADIEVAFFVRVNNTDDDIKNVAQSLGCRRASDQKALIELFDAKFSEALKTVGKQFDFVELYNERDKFKVEILNVIGTDLNGYVLDDCAIDFLEQTPIELLSPNNILDAEGIKKITELTAKEFVQANNYTREKEKTIKKQDVEAQEAILELERQRVEAVEKQKREIAEVSAREQAEAKRVSEEERLKGERARITTEEEISISEENKERQIIVARKSKERTDAVETERVEKDRMLEATERERIVTLAQIDKEKAVEVEKRNIQDVIRERVVVERAVVEQQEKIKDTEEFATADRLKQVTVTKAEMDAQQALVKEVKAAEASKAAADFLAEQRIVEAEAERAAAEKETLAQKMLAEAKTANAAAIGLADAQVLEAKAAAIEKEGTAEANVLQRKAVAEAKGIEARASAVEKEGTAEASVMHLKFTSEAKGIEEKANAMKLFDGVGREHEEFKLRLNKEKDIEIAAISAQQEIAESQAGIVGEALKSARIDIVGGETTFFDKIVDSIKAGKSVDRFVHNSEVLTDVKNSFFNGNPEYFRDKLQEFVDQFNMSFDDVKDLSVAALIGKMLTLTDSDESKSELNRMLSAVKGMGIADKKVNTLDISGQSLTVSGKKS
ncbi:Inner membrane protein YqiK [Symmachiella dynata]|uniref:Inner membrane protein YqiK n=1 Tax=Symmachiella dynata TaxID=2527995 RepID=A0A517ZLQ9_9PLAN|nr:flotillin family protein [Symmachiella dynata]QDU43414.1 Inner membrane protein YqiK [Symmachiella dynata]